MNTEYRKPPPSTDHDEDAGDSGESTDEKEVNDAYDTQFISDMWWATMFTHL